MKAYRSFLKTCKNDQITGQMEQIFYPRCTNMDPDAQADEWIVEPILRHRVNLQGNIAFLSKSVSYDAALGAVKKIQT